MAYLLHEFFLVCFAAAMSQSHVYHVLLYLFFVIVTACIDIICSSRKCLKQA